MPGVRSAVSGLGVVEEFLHGDVVGALTALTGERFAYDREAWRDWWARAREDWPAKIKSLQ